MKSQKSKYNKSTYFLLPLLEIPFYEFNQGMGCFINTYVDSDMHYPRTENNNRLLYILLDRKFLDFDALDTALSSLELVSKSITKDQVLLVYELIKFDVEYVMFRVGKYSSFGGLAKEIITHYISSTVKDCNTGKKYPNINYMALFPNEESRRSLGLLLGTTLASNAEILSVPNKKDEFISIVNKKFKPF